ncbi:MAG: hypothetical protein AAGD40_04920 [Pseudomonadota bacterium]
MFSQKLAVLAACCLLVACQSATTTSGSAYLQRWAAAEAAAPAAADPRFQDDLRAAAAVEPLLRFPARLGVARLLNGQLSPIPPGEGAHWLALLQAEVDYGEFVEISPLAATFAATDIGLVEPGRMDPIQRIRLGAARQHVDAVFVYEVFTKSERKGTPLLSNILDATIIGGLLVPNRQVGIEAFAQTALIDVRNGYIYGQARGSADAAFITTSAGGFDRTRRRAEDAGELAVAEMSTEIETMLATLARDLPQEDVPEAELAAR